MIIGAYVYLAPLCKFMKIVREDLCLLATTNIRVTSIFNMTGKINLRDFTCFHTNFLNFRFQKSSDFIDFK